MVLTPHPRVNVTNGKQTLTAYPKSQTTPILLTTVSSPAGNQGGWFPPHDCVDRQSVEETIEFTLLPQPHPNDRNLATCVKCEQGTTPRQASVHTAHILTSYILNRVQSKGWVDSFHIFWHLLPPEKQNLGNFCMVAFSFSWWFQDRFLTMWLRLDFHTALVNSVDGDCALFSWTTIAKKSLSTKGLLGENLLSHWGN